MAVVAALYLTPFVRMFCDAPDAGVFLTGADLVKQGAIPSKDFVEPQGPGSFLWLAGFFRIFGANLATARAVLDATGVGMGLLAFYLSRRLGATGFFATLFVLTMSVPLMPINSPHYDSNLFAMGALAAFLPAWDQVMKGEEPRACLLVAAAVLCGLTTWTIQQKGLYLEAALMICLGWAMRARAVKALLTLGVPYTAVVLLPFVAFALLGSLPDLIFANYIWPLQKYGELNAAPYGFPLWGNLAAARGADIFTSAPLLMVAVMPLLLPLAARLAGHRWVTTPMMPYWLTSYALWFSELHRLDIGHLRNGAMLIAVFFFSICEAAKKPGLRRAGLVLSMFVGFTGVTNLLASLQPDRMMETRRGTLRTKDNAALLEFLQANTRAGEEVFVYPYQPIYYFVEDLRNPTRYSYMQYHLHTDEQFLEATQDLDRKNVRYVVFDSALSGERFKAVFPAYEQPEKSRLIMEPYLEAHYRLRCDLGRFRILERRDSTTR